MLARMQKEHEHDKSMEEAKKQWPDMEIDQNDCGSSCASFIADDYHLLRSHENLMYPCPALYFRNEGPQALARTWPTDKFCKYVEAVKQIEYFAACRAIRELAFDGYL